jgi:Mg2+-importing ATPase
VEPITLRDAATVPVEDVLARLDTSAGGLDVAEADRRRVRDGANVLGEHRVTAVAILVRQLRNPLLILLVGASAVSIATGDATGGVIIVAIVLLSVLLGFVNEYRTERAVTALHANVERTTTVRRGGVDRRLPITELVVGDIIELRVGDVVAADVRLIEANGLECDEAILTGEAAPSHKTVEPAEHLDSPVDLPSCAFMGTIVHRGSGLAVVVATGASTSFGGIVTGLGEQQAVTAFQTGLRDFSKLLVRVAAVLTIGIFVVNVALSRPFLEALLFSLAIAIGITPQLLPAIVSVSMATGSRRLARKQVLVKRLVTIEDLGNVEVLFTDKTGTLTDGAISFERALDASGRDAPGLLALGQLCNEATRDADGGWNGNDLDVALKAAAAHGGPDRGIVREDRVLASLPFDHDRQLASVLVVDRSDGARIVTKGAPEAVLARCGGDLSEARSVVEGLFAEGARVIAVATRAMPGRHSCTEADEHDLDLRGFFAFSDPPKADAAAAVGRLARLGVEVKVITGDNGTVAVHVCDSLGIDQRGVLTGSDLDGLDDPALAAAIPGTSVFARVGPDQKARIIKVAGGRGVDVAFLGDGVNDAVALHAADVGISVDSARDVAKDAADIVLLDKDLGVIADGIVEGRRTFANTMKYVLMATSSNFGNMFSAAGASSFLPFLPMLPSQILLNNLLYDVGQLAIPSDDVDEEVLARPAAWDLTFVRRFMWVFGPVSSLFDFATFGVMLLVLHAGHDEFRSGWFIESLATQTLVVFLIRTRRVPFVRSRPSLAMVVLPVTAAAIGVFLPFSPFGRTLGFTTLPATFFMILMAMIATYLVLVELVKQRFYRSRPSAAEPRRVDPQHRHRRHLHRRAAPFVHVHPGPRIVPRRTSRRGTRAG